MKRPGVESLASPRGNADAADQPPPLRIGLFHTTLPEPGRKLGGVEVVVHRLANALSRPGGDVVTVFSLSPRPTDAQYQHVQLFPKHPWLRDSHLGRLVILPLLLNRVRFDSYDVLHLHGDDWFFLLRALPTVRTLHGSALEEARTATNWKRKLLQYLIYPLEQMSARLCALPLAVGPQTMRIYPIKTLIDNGIDTKLFCPGAKSPRPRILFVGTWAGRKRGEFLFRAFVDHVLPDHPDAELCMVSDFCPEHPSVIAETFPTDARLAERYREAWVFAYPSTYEGFGISYIEAMASGTPVLCSPNSGADYVLCGNRFGVIADDATFGAELNRLLSNEKQRRELAEVGVTRAAEFAWPVVAARHRALYADLVRGRKRSPSKAGER